MESRGQQGTLFGHPVGLFTLFFAEMWERFSYYGMRALLIFYMLKGFLGLNDSQAYGVYGAYTALVYATPFIGGILADKLLGARHAVIIGGILMSAGHLLMTIETNWAFFTALALLIVGNGFFKPNISTIVGGLYPPDSKKKDAGFTLFYMGINLGAAMSPLLCGYIGETYGWHKGFGLATFGMLTGLIVFAAPRRVAQVVVLVGCIAASASLFIFQNNVYQLAVNGLVGVAMLLAGVIGTIALQRGGVPQNTGLPKDPVAAKKHAWKVYLGILVSVPLLSILVQRNVLAGYLLTFFGVLAFGWITFQAFQRERVARQRLFVVLILMFFSMLFWACFEQAGSSINNFTDRNVDRVIHDVPVSAKVGETITVKVNQEQVGYKLKVDQKALYNLLYPSLVDMPAKKLLTYSKSELTGLPLNSKELDKKTAEALGMSATELATLNNNKQIAVIYEKIAGKPLPTTVEELQQKATQELGLDAAKVSELKADDLQRLLAHVPVGLTKERLQELSTEQLQEMGKNVLGYVFPDSDTILVNITLRDELRRNGNDEIEWQITEEQAAMSTDGAELPASIFQSVNAIFIILLAPIFSIMWEKLSAIGREPSTPVKFALGVIQLGIGFGCLWKGAASADERGMVFLVWLLLGYLFQTTGELCLSPVGLSMVTKLSPADIVSTVMGGWFMATAFSNYLAGMIAKLTGVQESDGGSSAIPAPLDTVDLYGVVFYKIAVTAIAVGILCLAISPILRKWMHEDVATESDTAHGH